MAEPAPTRRDVPSARGTYPVHFGEGVLARSWELVGELVGERPVVIVTQRRLRRLYGKALLASWPAGRKAPLWVEVPQGEKAKTLAWLQRCATQLARENLPRQAVLFALGGGVVGDLAGFLAATYMRGIDWVQVPTSLLAQVDSSVGGKVAVNLPQGKNLVGAFYAPDAVLVDPGTLATLPREELLAGCAEVAKYGLLRDRDFFEACTRELPDPAAWLPFLVRSVEHKAEVVARDEREAGERMCLNLGHTLGHAIEAAGGYKTWVHGQAVAIGIRYVYRLARRLGAVSDADVEAVDAFFVGRGVAPPTPRLPFDGLLRRMRRDKKADAAGLRWVMPTGIGSWRIQAGVPEDELRAAWKELVDAN